MALPGSKVANYLHTLYSLQIIHILLVKCCKNCYINTYLVGIHNFSGPHVFIVHSPTEGINIILRLGILNTAACMSCSISKEKIEEICMMLSQLPLRMC